MIVAMGVVYAVAPNPGHTIAEIEGLSNNGLIPSEIKATSSISAWQGMHDGNFGGLAGMNNWVKSISGIGNNNLQDYHACTKEEIIRYIQAGNQITAPTQNSFFWYASGMDLDSSSDATCWGWSKSYSTNHGIALNFYQEGSAPNNFAVVVPYTKSCDNEYPVLACKY